MKSTVWTVLIAALVGALFGALAAYLVLMQGQDDVIGDFYRTETAVHVSPHTLRTMMDAGDESFILVDLRTSEEYQVEHIIGAVSIPGTGTSQEIVRQFRELEAAYPERDIIVYCYSMSCMLGRKVGNLLADEGIYVRHLGIGWSEWRYYWDLWNPETELNSTQASDYVFAGASPGVPRSSNSTVCPVEGPFSC